MRLLTLVTALAALASTVVGAPRPANAFGYDHGRSGVDPYLYTYEQPGYYPYYNSGYWRPRHLLTTKRPHLRLPQYYRAWGYPDPTCCYRATREHRHLRHW